MTDEEKEYGLIKLISSNELVDYKDSLTLGAAHFRREMSLTLRLFYGEVKINLSFHLLSLEAQKELRDVLTDKFERARPGVILPGSGGV